jgi:hypothetical protein
LRLRITGRLPPLRFSGQVKTDRASGDKNAAKRLAKARCLRRHVNSWNVRRDQGHGFDPNKVADPVSVENLTAEHRRGIHLMKMAMDEVSKTEELKSAFGSNRRTNKEYPPSACRIELWGHL